MVLAAGDRAIAPGEMNIQVFAVTGTWNKPAGLRGAWVRVLGGGGGGGGVDETATGTAEAGYGGAGGYSEKWYTSAQLSSTESVTIGAAGAGGAAGNNVGLAGGTSIFKGITCTGGQGGLGAGNTTGTQFIGGGTGGTATGGDINVDGQAGGNGRVYTGVANLMGYGGNTPLGTGGDARTVVGNGVGASGFGAGGGGGYGAGTSTDRSGGAGAIGTVIIVTMF